MYKKPEFEATRTEMLDALKNNILPIAGKELVAVSSSMDRICAEDVYSLHMLPNKAVSSFDGVAVHFADFVDGIPDTSAWQEGRQYCFGNTGVALADGFDTVIAIEKVSFDQKGQITFNSCPKKCGEYVGCVGGQIGCGEILAHKGEIITPSLIGVLISGGIVNISVLARPKVAFIPTGDELVPCGYPVPLGKNIESNSYMLKAYIEKAGGEAILLPIIADDMTELQKAITYALSIADLVVICAGSSKGSKDFTIELLESMGQVLVYELAHGPGKHCSLAIADNKPIIGLPGPPGGADLTAFFYVTNAINLLNGQRILLPLRQEAILSADINGGMIDFVNFLKITKENGKYYAEPVALFGKTRANGYHAHNALFYAKKMTSYKAGETIMVELKCPIEYITED